MKVFLMYKDRDFDLSGNLPFNHEALIKDLELETLSHSMACRDKFLFEVTQKALLLGLGNTIETIIYRQNILKDCIKNQTIIKELYDLSIEAIASGKNNYWYFSSKYPSTILSRSINILQILLAHLKKLRWIADEYADRFSSEGLTRFFAMIERELPDEYFQRVQDHLKELKFRDGVLISAQLGQGNRGTNYVLRKTPAPERNWLKRIFSRRRHPYTFHLHPRDENGARALSELRNRGINLVANALAQSTDHVLSFFSMLRTELAFYIGCLNLHEELSKKGEPVCFPRPLEADEHRQSFRGLYDVCLSLTLRQKTVGNDLEADRKNLVIITGANQGGKSTFLRSIGLSQMMMQCGMFVPAESFAASVCDGLFTHYTREEDAAMESGKLDEELARMSEIIDNMTPNSMILFNESFAATNEREGSEIARQIICALLEKHIRIFFVTHLYEFAHGFVRGKTANAVFLRAERQDDGSRTFRLVEGEPMRTSYGEDLYQLVFLGRDATSERFAA